ncbi:MAG: polymerase subunit delta, partial [Sphingomonas bacterium]|nr:polymerase subunit delta [Sphingomonas bacterium]
MPLFGHDAQIGALRAAMADKKVHHAWLLTGPQGVGKASFALAAARRLLAEAAGPAVDAPGLDVPEEHPVARYMAAGSHPDFRLMERLRRETTGDLARNITIAQVRGLQALFATTTSLGPRRVVLIDSVDDLEADAANALLKSLEEPPADSLFLLVSHAPARLLPTIRSRCRTLRFGPLGRSDMAAALRAAMPEASESEIAALVVTGAGAPGRAIRFAGLDIDALEQAMDGLIARGDPTNAVRVGLSRKLALKAAQPRYEAFLERAPTRIAEHARGLRGAPLEAAIDTWSRARDLAGGAVRLSLDAQSVVFELAGLLAGLAPE